MLTLPQLDRTSTSPIWFQIMRAIEANIADGTWAAGDRLPSESELRAHFSASRTSVRDALARLETAGIIWRQQGKGAFVKRAQGPSAWTLPSAPSLLGEYSEDGRSALTSEILRAGVGPLPPWAAAVVGRESPDGQGFVLERVRAVASRTAVHVINYLPTRFAAVLPDLRNPRASLYAAITNVAGVRIARMHRTIEAVSADNTLASLLGIEPGHPIVVVEAVAYDRNGEPVDVSRASVRTDRLRITVDTGFDAEGISIETASGHYPRVTRPRTHGAEDRPHRNHQ
ncbi:MAG: GntR family transcriptional regulator [Beutenbergiaceae bacterium]